MPALRKPTTAVIGAGISGLTAGKMLGDYGVPYTCLETSDRIGGNWAFGNPNGHSSAYVSLHIDTSKHQLSFRDFPMPEDYPDFPHHTLIKDYLDSYADTFGLRDHLEFENAVLAPALYDLDAFGPVRARQLIAEHERQRSALTTMLGSIYERRDRELAGDMLGLLVELRVDMAYEEETLLHPDLLRDDCVAPDTETG